jgi:Flp pilus assembly protein TadG
MFRSRGELGQGLVEFAVIFPIFIMLVFVILDGGIVMGRYGEVNHAAKEGARYAATGATTNAVADRVRDQSQGILDSVPTACSGAQYICVQYFQGPDDQDAGEVGSTVRVRVRYEYELFTPLPNVLGADDWTIASCAVARLERPRPSVSGSGGIAEC